MNFQIECNILNELLNTSDHNPIKLHIDLNGIPNSVPALSENLNNSTIKVSWQSEKWRENYNVFIKSNLKISRLSTLNEIENPAVRLNSMYKTLCDTITDACKFANSEIPAQQNKNWWTSELGDIKKQMKLEYDKKKLNPNIFDLKTLKDFKKKFRKLQRKNKYLFEVEKLQNIDHLFKINNKEQFWKALKKLKSSPKDNIDESHINEIHEQHILIRYSRKTFLQTQTRLK